MTDERPLSRRNVLTLLSGQLAIGGASVFAGSRRSRRQCCVPCQQPEVQQPSDTRPGQEIPVFFFENRSDKRLRMGAASQFPKPSSICSWVEYQTADGPKTIPFRCLPGILPVDSLAPWETSFRAVPFGSRPVLSAQFIFWDKIAVSTTHAPSGQHISKLLYLYRDVEGWTGIPTFSSF